jgi:hypothetical protein
MIALQESSWIGESSLSLTFLGHSGWGDLVEFLCRRTFRSFPEILFTWRDVSVNQADPDKVKKNGNNGPYKKGTENEH